MTSFRPCVLIPTYNNPKTIRAVVNEAKNYIDDIVVVDDGSDVDGQNAVEKLAQEGLAHIRRRTENGGKGAAVKTGFQLARELGFTHALQIDADGQHSFGDIPLFLDIARSHPKALVLGQPIFDESAPKARTIARRITIFWTHLETGKPVIGDPMCGFRVYPLDFAINARAIGNAMDFDPEIAVRLVWQGLPTINVPTRVRYVHEKRGGVSHFRLLQDNLLIAWLHTRLIVQKVFGVLGGKRFGPARELTLKEQFFEAQS